MVYIYLLYKMKINQFYNILTCSPETSITSTLNTIVIYIKVL